MNNHSCRTIWCAATDAAPNRAATAAADRKQAWKARLRASRSRPMASCARSSTGTGRSDTGSRAAATARSRCSACRNSPAPTAWPATFADRRPDQTQPAERTEAVHQRHAQQRRQAVAGQHVAQRAGGVLHAAHPAVAGQRHQHQRRTEQRHPQPGLRGGRHRSPVAEHPRHRPGDELPDAEDQQPDRERQPGGLDALADGRGAAPGAVQPGRPGRGAVGQEVELARDLREHDAGHGQPGQRHRPQPTDDGGVDEQVERLGGEHRQGGAGQPQRSPAAAPGRSPRSCHPRVPADVDERGRHVAPDRGG